MPRLRLTRDSLLLLLRAMENLLGILGVVRMNEQAKRPQAT
jgi:hypothetical protein